MATTVVVCTNEGYQRNPVPGSTGSWLPFTPKPGINKPFLGVNNHSSKQSIDDEIPTVMAIYQL